MIFLFALLAGQASLLAQANGGDPGFLEASEKAAKEQLAAAYAKQDWGTVSELASQLKDIQAQKAKNAKPKVKPAGQAIALGSSTQNAFDALAAHGFSLRQDSGAGLDKPARFAYSKNYEKGTDGSFTADFYLKWEPVSPILSQSETSTLFYSPAASVEGKLDGTSSSTTDALKFRLENTFFTVNTGPDRFADGVVATLSFLEESDRDFNVSRMSAELWLTLNKFDWFIGQYSGVAHPGDVPAGGKGVAAVDSKAPWIQVRWRPFIGVDAGGTVRGQELLGDAGSNVRFMARGAVDVELNFLSQLLGLKSVNLNFDDTAYFLTDPSKADNYIKTGINFQFNDNAGIGVQYKVGNDAPKFLHEKELDVALTLKFG
jgi:hypothetical protein